MISLCQQPRRQQGRRQTCALVLITLVTHSLFAAAAPEQERLLIRKTLEDGWEVVAIQGPLVPAPALRALLSADAAAAATSFCSLSFELRSAKHPPLRLHSRAVALSRDDAYGEFRVLDLLPLPDRLVVALAWPNSRIEVWEVAIGLVDRAVSLRARDWSALAAAVPAPPGRLAAKVSYDEAKRRLRVEVTDSVVNARLHTVFEQKDDAWEFVRVQQWDEHPRVAPVPLPPVSPLGPGRRGG